MTEKTTDAWQNNAEKLKIDYQKALAYAQGLVDGYMRALLESGVASRNELLAVVREQRTALDGSPIRALYLDEVETFAA